MLNVLFEDNHLLVLNKPPLLATQPSLDHADSLEDRAKAWLKEKYQKPGAVFLHPIHRIDAPVSGIVVFAKTSKALSRLQEEMRAKRTYKRYLALVEGEGILEEGMLKHFMLHGEHLALEGGNKEALLSYRVLERMKGQTLLEILLITGRYHQIRAQFSWVGHPIVGDRKYGSVQKWPAGIALHHAEFRIQHPVSREEVLFQAPLPAKAWAGAASFLKGYQAPQIQP